MIFISDNNQDEKISKEKQLESLSKEDLIKLLKEKEKQLEQPLITPSELAGSFINAIDTMREKGITAKEKPVNYRISKLDLKIKSGVAVDENKNLKLSLPKAGETPLFAPEQLSTIKFSVSAIPKIKEKKEEKVDEK
ncbi:MAG: hypothetical protein ACFFCE_07330 [Promethearchaeota archaeon]